MRKKTLIELLRMAAAPGSFERDELECTVIDLDAAADTLEVDDFSFSSLAAAPYLPAPIGHHSKDVWYQS